MPAWRPLLAGYAGYSSPCSLMDQQRAKMPKLPDCWKVLLRDDSGVSSIEYALLGSLIAVTIVGAVISLGDAVKAMYQGIADKMP